VRSGEGKRRGVKRETLARREKGELVGAMEE